jgi:hypothetical protein
LKNFNETRKAQERRFDPMNLLKLSDSITARTGFTECPLHNFREIYKCFNREIS